MKNDNLGSAKQKIAQLASEKNYSEAHKQAEALVKRAPKDAEAWFVLAQLRAQRKEYSAAVTACMRAAQDKTSPVYAQAVEKALQLCVDQQLPEQGVEPAKAWMELYPDRPAAYYFLALFLFRLNYFVRAEQSLLRALEADPKNIAFMDLAGRVYAALAEHERARTYFAACKKVKPDALHVYVSDVFNANAHGALNEKKVFKLHCDAGRAYESTFSKGHTFEARDQASKIRIGYLSPDFYHHSVAYFFQSVLDTYSRDKFEVFCYSDGKHCDDMTKHLKGKSDHWCETHKLSDEGLLEQIREDQIDILVDLAGYTGQCRLAIYAMRAAPIQVSYLGYPNTTGLSQMDYRLVDDLSDPEGQSEAYHTETLLRLDGGFLCYSPLADAPEPSIDTAAEPELRLGSFNAFHKITDQVLDAWGEILTRLPQASLLIKAKALKDEPMQARLLAKFKARGVAPERLTLVGWTQGKHDHLDMYSNIDLHLDTFPYNGTTTTFEALWQGVPTLTLAGSVHRSRVGLTIMKRLDLSEFVAESADDYINKAVGFAANKPHLSELRPQLRERLGSSSLMDKKRFGETLEAAYLQMLALAMPDDNKG